MNGLEIYDIHTEWKKRLGKKYISCNISSVDTDIHSGKTAVIWETEENGVIFIKLDGGSLLPLKTISEYETDMMLTIPDGSRDIYVPFIIVKEGIEYLHISSEDYINTDAIPFIQTGRVFSDVKEKKCYIRPLQGRSYHLKSH